MDMDLDMDLDKDMDKTTTPPTPCEGDASAVVTNDFLKNHPESLKAVQDEAAKCGIPITEDQ